MKPFMDKDLLLQLVVRTQTLLHQSLVLLPLRFDRSPYFGNSSHCS